MKKLFTVILLLLAFTGCNSKSDPDPVVAEKLFSQLQELTFSQLDEYLLEGKTMIVYFGWVENCSDSTNIQDNYFEEKLIANPEWLDKIYVVNLDKELPEALGDKELRQPMYEAYGVQYSPTLVYYVEGEMVNLVEWTPLTADPLTAIDSEVLDEFFAGAGY